MLTEQLSEKAAVSFLGGYFKFRNLHIVHKFVHYMLLERVPFYKGFEVFISRRFINQHIEAYQIAQHYSYAFFLGKGILHDVDDN